jgi:precorrin-6A/cobalt-precorrin-6A reductase
MPELESTMKRILILGGTGDAAELAMQVRQLPGLEVIHSLAGRTERSRQAIHGTRVGGFGGAAGLADYLRDRHIVGMIDATHPFAAQISWNAAAAATTAKIPRLRLLRPAWERVAGDRWIEVDSLTTAAAMLPGFATRVFLAIGRQEVTTFANLDAIWFLLRMVDLPAPDAILPRGQVLLERGPFGQAAERALLQRYGIEAIVSKNSGGAATYGKIAAARDLQLPVVIVQRPPLPIGECVADTESALQWIRDRL